MGFAVKVAELAPRNADIRDVDVAVDLPGDDIVGVNSFSASMLRPKVHRAGLPCRGSVPRRKSTARVRGLCGRADRDSSSKKFEVQDTKKPFLATRNGAIHGTGQILLERDRFRRAHVGARTAFGARFGIDNIYIPCRDSSYRTFIDTSTASSTSVSTNL